MKDTIYREDAIKVIHSYFAELIDLLPTIKDSEGEEYISDTQKCNEYLMENKVISGLIWELPSAEPKTGKWIRDKKTEREEQLSFHKVWTCSRCGEQQCRPKPSKFCPNCGSNMEG